MTHICASKLTIIVSDNGLASGRRQAIIWNNAGILLIGPLGTAFSDFFLSKFKETNFVSKWLSVLSVDVLRASSGTMITRFGCNDRDWRVKMFSFCYMAIGTQWNWISNGRVMALHNLLKTERLNEWFKTALCLWSQTVRTRLMRVANTGEFRPCHWGAPHC